MIRLFFMCILLCAHVHAADERPLTVDDVVALFEGLRPDKMETVVAPTIAMVLRGHDLGTTTRDSFDPTPENLLSAARALTLARYATARMCDPLQLGLGLPLYGAPEISIESPADPSCCFVFDRTGPLFQESMHQLLAQSLTKLSDLKHPAGVVCLHLHAVFMEQRTEDDMIATWQKRTQPVAGYTGNSYAKQALWMRDLRGHDKPVDRYPFASFEQSMDFLTKVSHRRLEDELNKTFGSTAIQKLVTYFTNAAIGVPSARHLLLSRPTQMGDTLYPSTLDAWITHVISQTTDETSKSLEFASIHVKRVFPILTEFARLLAVPYDPFAEFEYIRQLGEQKMREETS